jgi:ubiquinone/menaquinone biosynthesis C-methylase UbiE
MLPRVLEPEVMDTPAEAASYDAMDHAEVNARFVTDFLASHGPMRGGEALDLGTGTALIPIELCRQDQGARVLGVDLARHMLEHGERNVAKADLTGRVRLMLVDAKGVPFPDGSFEAVISNSIVHHVPEPAVVLREMARLVAPGVTLFVRDLARPDSIEDLEGLVATYAGHETAEARGLFAASLHAALTLDEVRAIIRALGAPEEGVRMTSDRHWTWSWRRGP